MNFLKELLSYIVQRKKFWLIPILIFLLVFGGLFVVTQGTVYAPLIYTIF